MLCRWQCGWQQRTTTKTTTTNTNKAQSAHIPNPNGKTKLLLLFVKLSHNIDMDQGLLQEENNNKRGTDKTNLVATF